MLTSLHYFSANRRMFLKNFYLKAKRSVMKPGAEGPAAYVLPGDERRPQLQAELLEVLQKQHVEISRATQAFTVTMPAKKAKKEKHGEHKAKDKDEDAAPAATTKEFPAGSYIIRMDQPYSRVADALLDYQYWSPDDPQKTPYDDTGWTFGELFGVNVARVTDARCWTRRWSAWRRCAPSGGVKGEGAVFAINNNAEPGIATLRYKLRDASMEATEEEFEAGGAKFRRGSILVKGVGRADLDRIAGEVGLQRERCGRGAFGEDASGAGGARGFGAYVVEHADRGLVAAGPGFDGRALRLHEHADGGED